MSCVGGVSWRGRAHFAHDGGGRWRKGTWIEAIQSDQSGEVSSRVAERNGTLEAELWLPDEWQVDALEVGEADVLAAEALYILDTVDENGPSKDVTEREDMCLL